MRSLTVGLILMLSLNCCSGSNTEIPLRAQEIPLDVPENPVPGTVTNLWAEPMVNQIEVPGQLDPNGIYYRPPHQAIVEIRQGRYQKEEFPGDKEFKDQFDPSKDKQQNK